MFSAVLLCADVKTYPIIDTTSKHHSDHHDLAAMATAFNDGLAQYRDDAEAARQARMAGIRDRLAAVRAGQQPPP